jgi:DNA-directed RNA polymerase III subunit RPC1
MFLWQYIPAPRVCISPSVAQDNARTEDDLTTKLAELTQHVKPSGSLLIAD